jgi:hypothetical protein
MDVSSHTDSPHKNSPERPLIPKDIIRIYFTNGDVSCLYSKSALSAFDYFDAYFRMHPDHTSLIIVDRCPHVFKRIITEIIYPSPNQCFPNDTCSLKVDWMLCHDCRFYGLKSSFISTKFCVHNNNRNSILSCLDSSNIPTISSIPFKNGRLYTRLFHFDLDALGCCFLSCLTKGDLSYISPPTSDSPSLYITISVFSNVIIDYSITEIIYINTIYIELPCIINNPDDLHKFRSSDKKYSYGPCFYCKGSHHEYYYRYDHDSRILYTPDYSYNCVTACVHCITKSLLHGGGPP